MYKDRRIVTVVPAHDEAPHVGAVIHTMPGFVDDIIVVDDASEDGTAEAAMKCGDRRLVILKTTEVQGVGGATILGYRKALEIGGSIIVKMDGDGQMPAQHLAPLLDAIIDQGYDYAKGNRFLAAESLGFMPRHRLVGNMLLTFLTKLTSGYWQIFDPQNGFTAIRNEALGALDLDKIDKGFFFENDMLIYLSCQSCRVKDVAMPAQYGSEKSDINIIKIGLTFPFLLARKFFHRIYQKYILRDFSPIALFLFLGMALFFWGLLFGLYLWFRTMLTGRATPTGTIMLSLLPLILGFQLLLQAIVLDIQQTPK